MMLVWGIMLGYYDSVLLVVWVSGVWPTYFGAPWVPTKKKLVQTMLALAEVGPEDVVYDLGCGDGRILVAAARDFGAKAVGVEIEPLKFLWCQLVITILGLRGQVTVRLGNLFETEISDASVVICYLLKETNQHLYQKLQQELKPGTRVISNIFTFPGVEPVKEEENILLYQI